MNLIYNGLSPLLVAGLKLDTDKGKEEHLEALPKVPATAKVVNSRALFRRFGAVLNAVSFAPF